MITRRRVALCAKKSIWRGRCGRYRLYCSWFKLSVSACCIAVSLGRASSFSRPTAWQLICSGYMDAFTISMETITFASPSSQSRCTSLIDAKKICNGSRSLLVRISLSRLTLGLHWRNRARHHARYKAGEIISMILRSGAMFGHSS